MLVAKFSHPLNCILECVVIKGQEDSLEEGIATDSRILAQRIPWTEEPDRLQSMGLQRVVLSDWTEMN